MVSPRFSVFLFLRSWRSLPLFLAIAWITLGLEGWERGAIAVTAPGVTITNTAVGSYEDPDALGTKVQVESNAVTVTVAEVAGITVNDSSAAPTEADAGVLGAGVAQGNGVINPDDIVYFTFKITNVGNDPTQFFVPGTPSSVTNGSFNPASYGAVTLIGYDVDGAGATPAKTGLSLAVPQAGSITSNLGIPDLASGSFAANGYLLLRIPIKASSTLNSLDSVGVVYGDTGSNDNSAGTQNQAYSASSQTAPTGVTGFGGYDIYTQDNSGTTNGDANGDPVNGDATNHRQEASFRQSATVYINDDFGDAPESYGHASHRTIASPNLYLGTQAPDSELISLNANHGGSDGTGDDNATAPQVDDEDGITLPSLTAGSTSYTIPIANITAIGTGTLYAWIDFNKNGTFEANEYQSVSVTGGTLSQALSWSGLSGITSGTTYSRFRLTSASLTDNTATTIDERAVGSASDGEVEDYSVAIAASTDYGDAPTSLTTIDAALTNIYPSASHVIDGLTYLGDRVDAETANQPTLNANGDDTNGSLNDEDGVTFPLAGSTRVLSSGASNTLTVKASRAGVLNAWIDWNQDGDWADAGEQIATNTNLAAGNNTLTVAVPNTAPHGATYARFRFSTTAGIGATGATTANGEVEDYKVYLALPAPVACSAGVLNSGFEEPIIAGTSLTNLGSFSGGNILILRENDVPWWGTISNSPSSGSGFNARNGIELWNRNQTAVSGTLPFEGNQFAEINANVAGRLYQDFAVPAGTQIRWQVAHRGRAGNDTMGVYMGAPGSETLQGSPQTTPNTEWRVYSGLYTVPSGQDVTRFALKAESTSGGAESSVGNFVDDVRLTNFCAPTVQGYKSAKLTIDADSNSKISPGDTLTYTLYYANASDLLTGPAAGFQINDPLPSGLTITAAGAQTITVSGGSTYAIKNPNYTGAASGAVSDLLNPGAFLDVGGTIRVDIPVTVNADAVGTLLNQGTSSANEFSGVNVNTDNVDDTTTGLPSGVSVPGSSVPQQQAATIDPTRIVVQNPTVSNPNILLVKRITAIQGQPINPNDTTTRLDQVVDDTVSSQQADDNDPGWPTGYLKGAINAGPVKPGDTLEYTIYFLSSGNVPAEQVRVCDRIQVSQSFQSGTYNGGTADLQLQIGDGTGGNLFNLTAVNDGSDRAEFVSAGTDPSNCNLQGPNDNGSLVLDLTGTTGAAPLPNLPNSTGTGTPNTSYGFFRFITKVDE